MAAATLNRDASTTARNFSEFRREPCPICGHRGWCRRFDDGAIECMRVESATPCSSGGWMHWPQGRSDDWRESIVAPPAPRRSRPSVDPDVVDRAYRALLAEAPLSEAHRARLRARGLSDEQIARHGYATLPSDAAARARIVSTVATAIGQDPAGIVPGFVRTRGRSALVDLAGILVPFRDDAGRIRGVQVRRDRCDDGRKYVWLSGGDGEGSIGQDGNVVHVAHPARPVSCRIVALTEGPLKANIVADRLGRVTLGVAGVANTGQVVAALNALGDVKEVWMAYDSDQESNVAVATAARKVARDITTAGYTCRQLTWPAEYGKGLDDALAAGITPVAIAHPAIAEKERAATEAVTRLLAERDAAVAANHARARILRNRRLPARPMANAVAGVFLQASTALDPYGKHAGQKPPGFIPASVRELSLDAGTRPSNGGDQLAKLEAAGLVTRATIKETIRPGDVNPDTGVICDTPQPIVHHFIAVAGHEHEAVTPAVAAELVDRMATYDSGEPERRGGARIPRCPLHPNADIIRTIVDVCSACERVVNRDEYPLPEMLLEPVATLDQSLLTRENDATEQSLLTRNDAAESRRDDDRAQRKTPLGTRYLAHEVRPIVKLSTPEQSLLTRPPSEISSDREARREAARLDLDRREQARAPAVVERALEHAPPATPQEAEPHGYRRSTEPPAGDSL